MFGFSGYIKYDDITPILKNYTYFPSYNIPYFKKMSEYAGFDKKVARKRIKIILF